MPEQKPVKPATTATTDVLFAELENCWRGLGAQGYVDFRGDTWSALPGPHWGAHGVGGAGSINHERLRLAIASYMDPVLAAEQWIHVLSREHIGVRTEAGRQYFWHTTETFSRNYFDWNVVAAWAARNFLLRPDIFERLLGRDVITAALHLIDAELSMSAAMLTLTMVNYYVVRRANRTIEWEGPGCAAAGIRSPVSAQVNPPMAKLWCRLHDVPYVSKKKDRWSDWFDASPPLTHQQVAASREWVSGRSLTSLVDVFRYCADVRTITPYQIDFYETGIVTLLGAMAGGLTSSTFVGAAASRHAVDMDFLHPYPKPVVRSGPWLGAGQARAQYEALDSWSGRTVYTASNLNDREAEKRGLSFRLEEVYPLQGRFGRRVATARFGPTIEAGLEIGPRRPMTKPPVPPEPPRKPCWLRRLFGR